MKEQDIIHNIEEKTKDLPIPDSISPDSMKKMLDENIEWNKHTSQSTNHTEHSKASGVNSISKAPAPSPRFIRRFTAAACVILCLVSSFSIFRLRSDQHEDFNSVDTTTSETDDNTSNSKGNKDPEKEIAYQANLQSPSSYDDYYDTLKSAYDAYYDSISDVTTYDNITGAIEEDAAESVSDFSEQSGGGFNDRSAITNSAEMKESSSAKSEKDYSATNTQEKNVDEGDIIKTDGTYIYKVISGFDNATGYTTYRLTITKAENGNLSAVTSFDLDDIITKKDNDDHIQFHEFYLYNDKLILMYSKSNYTAVPAKNDSVIVIYDLKDKSKPQKIKTLTQSGWYESSRISNGYLYTISNFSDTSLADKKEYEKYIPSINGETIACRNIYYPKDVVMQTTYVVTSLNLKNPEDFTDTKAIPTAGGSSYVSDSSIYFYATIYSDITKTEIMKLGYEKGKLTVGNSAVVTGYLYDSFALSEYNGHLRIVATIPANNISLLRSNIDIASDNTANNPIVEDVNALYILDEKMELTGKLTGLAPGEQIYSARFMGDIGYFVTYRNTDPLFSVDLSDPAEPKILGALKIPGFSNYLHFYSKDMLLGIGQETDPNTQEFLGLKLSMFDISNPSDVKEKDKYIIENSDFSYALYNHKAIMIDPEKNIFGFLYYGSKTKDYQYGYYYATYTYDAKDGFIQTASYEVNDGSEYESDAVRGLYIGDYFYLATNKSISSYKIGSENPIALVYFN
ncbi:MAG: beta-propeller domain-containing protein [Lachnospiraceae bacterium]|nr:beta-propeller domain-containing protein [Lachnospiraceae bacterium]